MQTNNFIVNIIIKTRFTAVHCWPNCPFKDVAYLRDKHRHLFYVTCKASCCHDDRDIEFIRYKRTIDTYLHKYYEGKDLGSKSCEMLCKEFLNQFPELNYVKVEEDGENGAEVYRS